MTARGRQAIGKFHKLKADALYLLHLHGIRRRAMLFTDAGMLEHFRREQKKGRFPPSTSIELYPAELPEELRAQLEAATKLASAEVSPGQAL